MNTTRLAGLGLAAVLSCTGALLFCGGTPANADTADLTFDTETDAVTPGSAVELTMTLTNTQSTEIRFVYQSIRPTWDTERQTDLKYALVSCEADGAACADTTRLGLDYTLPLAPGASRTVTLTYRVAPDSACGRTLGFSSYLYYEYGSGLFSTSDTFWSPDIRVDCPAAH
ncbi:hypothetical protein N4G70_15585 [Streptomyces sp. ASQP_92]|uniref:hypothetical protein n=1 Tax=Streptomyces sp. ASQP_92 TaxID=2979116 RepID=UPI0021C15982|nr:hypothetical protein [Streptomyces sp. ASQP_92]MCT9090277.1 hypothetical protein [Streptomyces sp. ASQP_92]